MGEGFDKYPRKNSLLPIFIPVVFAVSSTLSFNLPATASQINNEAETIKTNQITLLNSVESSQIETKIGENDQNTDSVLNNQKTEFEVSQWGHEIRPDEVRSITITIPEYNKDATYTPIEITEMAKKIYPNGYQIQKVALSSAGTFGDNLVGNFQMPVNSNHYIVALVTPNPREKASIAINKNMGVLGLRQLIIDIGNINRRNITGAFVIFKLD
jgi:hypothetical protein